ncbi:NUDIX hydrolase [Ketobacter alkanivorans]|uniref:Nudix hydrolase domain-containing protein n=1 Tax=Ketobacter alkanivorans TaxID=1917421 RepID=A0A2K9LKE3_9GAMM|nr:CoA pyrophosphatase [Ketobacter alkanivorans]AUM12752.1 hypothetical protein Kalk_10120 [Ketobacter alkanivorans]
MMMLGGWVDQAAVAVIYRHTDNGCELFFIQRAKKRGDPWSGDMAFPGGRKQIEDATLIDTAVRETWEETGLDLFHHGVFQHKLTHQLTRSHRKHAPMIVTPHLFYWQGDDAINLNHECDDALWIPLDFFNDQRQRSSLTWKQGHFALQLPCYRYGEKTVWGLTLRMLDQIRQRSELFGLNP